jgi:hypothetical protein
MDNIAIETKPPVMTASSTAHEDDRDDRSRQIGCQRLYRHSRADPRPPVRTWYFSQPLAFRYAVTRI